MHHHRDQSFCQHKWCLLQCRNFLDIHAASHGTGFFILVAVLQKSVGQPCWFSWCRSVWDNCAFCLEELNEGHSYRTSLCCSICCTACWTTHDADSGAGILLMLESGHDACHRGGFCVMTTMFAIALEYGGHPLCLYLCRKIITRSLPALKDCGLDSDHSSGCLVKGDHSCHKFSQCSKLFCFPRQNTAF